jgi:hypothetical protein
MKNFSLSDAGALGKLDISSFDFEVFKRKATVKNFQVNMSPYNEPPSVKGDIVVKNTDIDVNIHIVGPVDAPAINFTSVPERSEREIMASLLYGDDVTSLDNEELQSTDDFSAAIADRMISLTSMYLLASTPIDSVRYNPAKKAFIAKMLLDDKTSLSVGTTAETEEIIGVRRRISKSWAVTTEISKETSQKADVSASALLEWSKRF